MYQYSWTIFMHYDRLNTPKDKSQKNFGRSILSGHSSFEIIRCGYKSH